MNNWKNASDLLVAIQYNNVNDAEQLLTKKNLDPDISYKIGSCDNLPAICISVTRGLLTMTNLLIKSGCSVNTCDENGLTPLHLAIIHKLPDIVKLLIANNANVNYISNYGQTPLHLAAQYSPIEIIKLLVNAGAILNRKDSNGRTALMIACINNASIDVIDYLLNLDSEVNIVDNYGNSPLLYAIDCGYRLNTQIIERLLQSGADPDYTNANGKHPLLMTIRRSSEHNLDCIETVHNLIKYNCDLNIRESGFLGEHAIHIALLKSQFSIVELLIRYGCDVNIRNRDNLTVLDYVIKHEYYDLLKIMLSSRFLFNEINNYVNGVNDLSKNLSINCKQILIDHKVNLITLKNQCRIQIRKQLGRYSDELIKKLKLPECIQKYLLLHYYY